MWSYLFLNQLKGGAIVSSQKLKQKSNLQKQISRITFCSKQKMDVIRKLCGFGCFGVALTEIPSNVATCIICLSQEIEPSLQILRVHYMDHNSYDIQWKLLKNSGLVSHF